VDLAIARTPEHRLGGNPSGRASRDEKAGDQKLARMPVDQLHDAWQKAAALHRKEEFQEAWPLLEILTHLLGDYIDIGKAVSASFRGRGCDDQPTATPVSRLTGSHW
jgi:hypothetical protein